MPTDTSAGNNVLGQIFGSKDVSRAVAQNASTQSGLSPDLLKKMLPMLAMVVAGYMSKNHAAQQGSSGGGLGGMLGGLLGGDHQDESPLGGLGGLLGSGGAGGQRNPLDDVLRGLGR